MSEFFNYDNKVMQALDKFFNICYLSAIWVLACIPIVTIGAANTALYYTANKLLRHGRGYVWKDFWGAFRSNFKQSTIVWLITLGLSALMCLDTYIMWEFADAGMGWGKLYIFFVVILAFIIMWAIYVFPYIARFENTTKEIMKNSLLIAFAHLPKTLLMFALFVVSALLIYFFGFLIILVPGLYTWVKSYLMEGIFRKYMSEEDRVTEDERNGEYHPKGK